MVTASAPGKVILSGEHSVVYNQPALAGALDLRCQVTLKEGEPGLQIHATDLNELLIYSPADLANVNDKKDVHKGFDNLAGAILAVTDSIEDINVDVEISSKVPIGAGLGSSAATSVAIVAAYREFLDLEFDREMISRQAFEAEKIAHGTPSGIDNTTASLGGLVHFQAGESKSLIIEKEIPLLIVNTNIPRNTKQLVTAVRKRKETVGEFMDGLLENMGLLTLQIEECLLSNNIKLAGELFDINQGLLDAIGVNHPKLSELIYKARNAGALGAKLTGAGGGGCLIVLTDQNSKPEIKSVLDLPGIDIYETSISPKGVMVH